MGGERPLLSPVPADSARLFVQAAPVELCLLAPATQYGGQYGGPKPRIKSTAATRFVRAVQDVIERLSLLALATLPEMNKDLVGNLVGGSSCSS